MLKILDILKLNDWESHKFLRTMVAIHLVMLGAIGLDFMGLEIPILRQVVGFVYLTFVPGIILLRLLKIHRLGFGETILLSAGLSISFLMFSGLFLNEILSFFKIDLPLSFWNVLFFITGLTTLLSIISYKTDKFYPDELSHFKVPRQALYLIFMPVLSILGTYLVNSQNNNIVLMILFVLIALIPLLIVMNRIPSELYPLALFSISLSLLFSYSLISMYLTGFDIHQEYYNHKLVVNNAFWNSGSWGNVNSMLSIVILPAIYSYFIKMDGAWVFKIIYPIIFSFVPLGLYYVFSQQLKNNKVGFYSVFFLMSFYTFFTEMLSLARQEIAELYFVLLLYLMVQKTLNKSARNVLLLIFSASMVTSHYGLSYIYIILLLFIYLFSLLSITIFRKKGWKLPEFSLRKTTFNYLFTFYIVFLLLWYLNVSSSTTFKNIIYIFYDIYSNIFTDFFNFQNRDQNVLLALGIKDPVISSLGRGIHRNLQIVTQIFIIIGLYKLIIYKKFLKLKAEYFCLIMASMVILVLSIMPNFANKLNMTRIYHIALLTISPLFIIGGFFMIEKLIKMIRIKNKIKKHHIELILILGVLIPYFLFNTGLVYEITKDVPTSISLGMERMKDNNFSKTDYYNEYTPEQDVYSARWYDKNKEYKKIIYGDFGSLQYVLYSYGMNPKSYLNDFNEKQLRKEGELGNYYLYLRKFNVCEDMSETPGNYINIAMIPPLINDLRKVYSNGCGDIYEK